MREIIMRMYELYERYHNTKENMAWLGISFYAVFTLGIMRIFSDKEIDILPWLLWTSVGVLVIVMLCVLWFIIFHYKKKRCAAKNVDELENYLSRQEANSEEGLKEIIGKIQNINKNGVKLICSGYKSTEIPIIILLFILLAAQVRSL